MTIKRLLSFLLCVALLLPCIPAVSIAATEPVVYLDSVNGSDDNDGLTEETAVATLNGAYTALKNNIGTAKRGKVIFVNDYTFEFVKAGNRDFCSPTHSFEVVLTGKTPQTALNFKLFSQNRVGMRGPTTFENITVCIADSPAGSDLSIHGYGKLTIGEGVTTSPDPNLRPSLSSGAYWGGKSTMDLSVNSGDWANIYAGNCNNNTTGNAVLNFNGGTADKIGITYKHALNGDTTININGGTVNKLIAGATEASGTTNGNVTVNINSGAVTTEFDPDGVGTLTGTTTINLKAENTKITAPGTINVSTYTAGNLTLGHATSLNITGSVSGTTAVTVEPALRFNYNYITAPASTADDAFTFSQANMTVTSGNTKTWSNQDTSAGFTGLVLKVPSAQTVKLYPGTSGGSVITPDSTKTVDGYKYQYYANIMGTYRYVTTQSGYYSTTKVVYMSEAESLAETVVDATAGKKAGTGYEPSSVKDYSDEMRAQVPGDENALWWDDYAQYLNTPFFTNDRAAHQTTTQEEMEAYIKGLDDSNDNMYVYSMGKSAVYGFDMPIVIFTATDLSGAKTLEEAAALVNANNKVTVHYQGLSHGNEPASGEAALAQIGRMDTEYGDGLLENLNVYIIPRLNPDGIYLFTRNDGNGVNLNRDMLLARTDEIQLHHYVYNLFYPELVIDSHEYQYQPELVSGAYADVLFASGHNGNSGEAFIEYSELIARLPFDAFYENDLTPSYFEHITNTYNTACGRNYCGMRGSVSLLMESRGIGAGTYNYERRVVSHLVALDALLGYAAANSAELQAATDAERQRIATSGMTYEESDIVVLEHQTSKISSLKYTLEVFDLASGTFSNYLNMTPSSYRTAIPGRSRPRPTAYVIPAGESWTQDVLDLMDVHDVSYYFVPAGDSISLQQYTGTTEAAVLTAEQYYSFENGCYVLPMNQPGATVLALLMEPDIADENNTAVGLTSADAYGTLAQMEIIPCENNVFPIYRYVKDLNSDGTIDTLSVPGAPTGLTVVDITTADGTGSIKGFDASKSYEYRVATDESYTTIAAGTTELTDLAADTYYVRFKASGNALASADAVLTVRYNIPVNHCVYIDSAAGSDSNNGYSEAAPVATIKQAYAQLNKLMANAPEGSYGNIMLLADYDLGATQFTFPTHDYPVVFTAKTPEIALIKDGTTTQINCSVEISGDTTFQNMTVQLTGTGTSYNFNANGHNVVIGEGITCLPNSKGQYFSLAGGGWNKSVNPTSTNVTIKSGTWKAVYVGGYAGNIDGDANVTITGGTITLQVTPSYSGTTSGNVNINLSNITVPVLYGGNANKNNVGGNVTITLGEGASVPTIYAGSRDAGNVGGTVTLVVDGGDVSSTIYGTCKNTSGTIGGFELVLKDGSLNTIPTNVEKVTVDTTAGGQVSYPASLGVNTVIGNGVGKVGTTAYAPLQFAADNAETGYVQLMIDCTTNMTLASDLYLDLAGFDLGGSMDLNSFNLYGLDSTTDSYSDANMGYLTATVTNGDPEVHFKDDGTRLGQILRYVAVPTDQGYTFHRLYMGITHMSLRPGVIGVGYKAKFCADDTLKAYMDSFGYTLQLEGFTPHTATMDGNKLDSQSMVTLRVQNFDVENYGETNLYANVCVTLDDGTVIESVQFSMTFRDLLEAVNDSISDFNEDQLSALRTMLSKCDIPEDWDISNITA